MSYCKKHFGDERFYGHLGKHRKSKNHWAVLERDTSKCGVWLMFISLETLNIRGFVFEYFTHNSVGFIVIAQGMFLYK